MILEYYTYEEQELQCEHCNWKGLGKDAVSGEVFSELVEIDCPQCGENIGVVGFPTFREVLEHGTAEEKKKVKWSMGLYGRVMNSQFHEYKSLKAFDGPIDLEFREKSFKNDDWLEVYANKEMLWEEIVEFEYYKRFIEILRRLDRRYKGCIRHIEYMSSYTLFGDDYELNSKSVTPHKQVDAVVNGVLSHFNK